MSWILCILPGMETSGRTRTLRALLSGGDRRSIAQANRALSLIHANPNLVSEVAQLAQDSDWLVSMRAMDLFEKIAMEHPDWVEPHKKILIGALADSDKWEIHLQIVRALPLFDWAPAEQRRVIEILLRDVEHPRKFVKAFCPQRKKA